MNSTVVWKLLIATAIIAPWTVAHAEVTFVDKDGWRAYTTGFVETDLIYDTTRSLREVPGNTPIAPNSPGGQGPGATSNGSLGRTQMSIRNSRLGFGFEAPPVDDWKAKGYFELDFLGYDPGPSSSIKTSQNGDTEGAFFTNPTARIRHAYMQTENANGWTFLAGQTWEILGFQPYYFMSSIEVSPVSGMLYARTEQFRAMKTMKSDTNTLQVVAGIMRPPEADASYPDIQAGVRWSNTARQSGYTGGSGAGARKNYPMSAALSGAYRQFSIPDGTGTPAGTSNFTGYAVAADVFIPILAASDAGDPSGTLSLIGEYTTGQGYGDQFNGWTGGTANPVGSNSGLANTNKLNLDGGIGDYDTAGNFELIKLQTYNVHLQYHLPNQSPNWVGAGYGVLTSSNMDGLVSNSTTYAVSSNSGAVAYDKSDVTFVNYMHEFTPQLRMGGEWALFETRYADGTYGRDRRYQVSAWYTF